MEAATYFCSICDTRSHDICVNCTKDTCNNHLCLRCRCCSDCCVCEHPLTGETQSRFEVRVVTPPEYLS